VWDLGTREISDVAASIDEDGVRERSGLQTHALQVLENLVSFFDFASPKKILRKATEASQSGRSSYLARRFM